MVEQREQNSNLSSPMFHGRRAATDALRPTDALRLTRCERPRQPSTKGLCLPPVAQAHVWLAAAAPAC